MVERMTDFADVTTVVDPVEIPAPAGDTAALPAVVTAVPKKKHIGLVVGITSAVVVLAAAAFLAFCPVSPLYETVYGWLHPAPEALYAINPDADAPMKALAPGDPGENCRALTLTIEFVAPAAPAAPAEGEEEGAATAQARAIALAKEEAASGLMAGTLGVSPIRVAVVPDEVAEPSVAALTNDFGYVRDQKRLEKHLADLKAEAAEAAKGVVLTVPASALLSCVCYDPGHYTVSFADPIVDAAGNVWIYEPGSLAVNLTEDCEVALVLVPVDLSTATDDEYAAYLGVAKDAKFADALKAARELALTVPADEPDEGDDDPDTGNSGNTGSNTGGNNSSGGGNNTGSNGNTGGYGNTGGGQTTHTHAWSKARYTVEIAAYDETVVHPAEYNDWTECISVCSSCGANITGNVGPHLEATGHSGAYTDYIYHHDLVKDAWSEVVHHNEVGHWSHYCTVPGCDAYEMWYE